MMPLADAHRLRPERRATAPVDTEAVPALSAEAPPGRVYGVGVDVVDVARLERALQRTPSLAERIFTDAEAALGAQSRAARFAAKEAVAKALRAEGGWARREVEVITHATGAPSIRLHGDMAVDAAELGVRRVHVSLAHDGGIATAYVVAEC